MKNKIVVLYVSPQEEDHVLLRRIVDGSQWRLHNAGCLASAQFMLDHRDIGVVLSERELLPGKWSDLLEHIALLPHPPLVIVTSRLADERLWAEALNLGAWDVLARPFDRDEVLRSVALAWDHWQDSRKRLAGATRALAVAS